MDFPGVELTPEVINIVSFTNCIFEQNFIFEWPVTLDAYFDNTVFKQDVSFKNNIFKQDVSFANSVFEKSVSFCNSSFKRKARFYGAIFKGETDFNNTKFDDLADFRNATFCRKTIFYKTDFCGTTVFSSASFKENVLFTYTRIDKLLIIRDTNFTKGMDLSLAIISGRTSIFNIYISDFEDIPDTDDVSEFDENVSRRGIITRKNKRETFRILKNQLMINQNNIDALTFSSLELKAYTKQLHQDILSKKWNNTLQNYIILKFNWLSNKHGTSWGHGVVFTLLVGLLFFYFSTIATEKYVFSFSGINVTDFESCVINYLKFMLPTHSSDYMISANPKVFFYLWDFIGRIFVSYGIYQTIYAFRKFKIK